MELAATEVVVVLSQGRSRRIGGVEAQRGPGTREGDLLLLLLFFFSPSAASASSLLELLLKKRLGLLDEPLAVLALLAALLFQIPFVFFLVL